MSEKTEERKKVDWYIFIWAIGIIIVIVGWIFVSLAQIQVYQSAQSVKDTEIRVQLSQIQTDILWIREKLSKNQ